jgi:ketosteroid isomerase-like protein
MKLVTCAVTGLVMSFVVAGAMESGETPAHASQRASADALSAVDKDFRAFLREFEEGTNRFINGDATLWNQHVSRAEDATIMGGFGAYEVGGRAVRERYDWAVKRFRPSGGKMDYTYLTVGVSGDLAYTVTIDRGAVHLIDRPAPAPMALRVTTIFRKESGAWKLIHRHEDPLIDKTAPAAVIQKAVPPE